MRGILFYQNQKLRFDYCSNQVQDDKNVLHFLFLKVITLTHHYPHDHIQYIPSYQQESLASSNMVPCSRNHKYKQYHHPSGHHP